MRLGFTKTKKKKCDSYASMLPRWCICIVLLFCSIAMLADEPAKTENMLDPSQIQFPERLEGQSIKDLGVALQRHANGRIKTYFQAGQAWQVGAQAISFANNFTEGTYAADENIKITMLSETGEKEFWVDAERACVLLNEKVGKCFGFVKLESPDIIISGTNLVWNTVSTNLFTIEKNVTLKLKNLDSNLFEGK